MQVAGLSPCGHRRERCPSGCSSWTTFGLDHGERLDVFVALDEPPVPRHRQRGAQRLLRLRGTEEQRDVLLLEADRFLDGD